VLLTCCIVAEIARFVYCLCPLIFNLTALLAYTALTSEHH